MYNNISFLFTWYLVCRWLVLKLKMGHEWPALPYREKNDARLIDGLPVTVLLGLDFSCFVLGLDSS